MPTVDEEVAEIAAINDPEAIRKRRKGRRSQYTRLQQQLTKLADAAPGSLTIKELERKVAEARRSATLFHALQDRIEELLSDHEEQRALEVENGFATRDEYDKLISIAELLIDRHLIHQRGTTLARALKDLLDEDEPHHDEFQKAFEALSTDIKWLEQTAVQFPEDSHIQGHLDRVLHAAQRFRKLSAQSREKSKPARDTDAAFEDKTCSKKTKACGSHSSRLKVDLPKFNGEPTEWLSFKSLFASALERDGSDISEYEKTQHLLSCMTSATAKQTVKQFTTANDGYDQALKALEHAYGGVWRIYPHHVKALTPKETCLHTADSMRRTREAITANCKGLEDCGGNTLGQFLASNFISSFDKTLKYEWDRHWEDLETLPTIEKVCDFLRKQELRATDEHSKTSSSSRYRNNGSSRQDRNRRGPVATISSSNTAEATNSSELKCAACDGPRHSLQRCQVFQDMNVERRRELVNKARMCFNCLFPGHRARECRSRGSCRTCKSNQHHSLLHLPTPADQPTNNTSAGEGNVLVTYGTEPGEDTILATAQVKVSNGPISVTRRVLMDSGAVPSLITLKLADQLGLEKTQHTAHFTHAGGELITSRHKVSVTLASTHSSEQAEPLSFVCHVVDSLPETIPPEDPNLILDHPVARGKFPIADHRLGGHIDILLGVSDSLRCHSGPRVYTRDRTACIIATPFGWVLGGRFPGAPTNQTVLTIQLARRNLDSDICRLWELDQVPSTENKLSKDEEQAVEHFLDTHQRDPVEGRFIVRLPRKEVAPPLGESRLIAVRRYLRNEKSLKAKGQWDKFQQVMNEYFDLRHAEIVPKEQLNRDHYYFPVHGVAKESSTTTKLRAVFDASCKTSSGHSLNDQLLPGPNLYPLLTSILNRFRMQQIALTADISKMFREILLHPEERDYHRFIHRSESGQLVSARMKRLTFGVTSSPFLATQTLHQLAQLCTEEYPKVAHTIRTDFYVDDCLSGAPTIDEAKTLAEQLVLVFQTIGMKLRKFRTNSEELLQSIPEELRETDNLNISDPTTAARTLGIHWQVRSDTFHVVTPQMPSQDYATKRAVASTAAQIYDVLGLWAPVTVVAKILLQQLWRLKLDWDTEAPESITKQWQEWMAGLSELTQHPITRKLISEHHTYNLQLHGFADASSKAYGAVVYIRAVYPDLSTSCNIVTAKSRVAPVKPVTIPRLELTAAVLLTRLLASVASDLSIPLDKCYGWTDSSIVLSWLNHAPETLRTYEANRVTVILELLSRGQWRHVRSEDNPADLPSRGALTSEIVNSQLWWHGPSWLTLSPEHWPVTKLTFKSTGEGLKTSLVALATPATPTEWTFWRRFSDFGKLVRITAYCLKFIHACRRLTENMQSGVTLTTNEIGAARIFVMKRSQQIHFPEIYDLIRDAKIIPKSHVLGKYDVEIDDKGLIIIHGRVKKSAYQQRKSQIVLSLRSNITKLMILTCHRVYRHPGTSTMLSLLSENFYIPKLRNFLKQLSRSCVVCQKAYAQPTAQKMGCLPTVRTTPAPPFSKVGIDFAGPFLLTRGNPRKPTRIKTYAVIFVCLVTRAIHLELCGDLSTDGFVACLRRFCGRRGTPTDVYTDNGTNFIGAKNEIEEIQKTLNSESTRTAITNFATDHQLHWHLSPPRAPHFGGIWEAGVKAMKVLLRKNLSTRPLRYDELETVLVEVEAVLNSRPSEPYTSTDPDAIELLTPGHFLIGRPLLAPPPTTVDNTDKPQLLKRWSYIQRLTKDLWVKWRATYLQAIKARSKWRTEQRNFQAGDIVIVKDDSIRERTWPLARIVKVYPGTDGRVRVVELVSNYNTYKRAVNRLVLLIPAPPTSSSSSPEDVRATTGDCLL